MGGKRLSAADRLLGTGEFSTGSDLSELEEGDIWEGTGTAARGEGSYRNWRGDREQPCNDRELSRALDPAAQEVSVQRRRGSRTATSKKTEPMSVPDGGRTSGFVEEEEAAFASEDDEWVPPHEYVARVHRNTEVATSVFEGVGRKLKGRELSRVRDAVWNQTGFFG